MVNFLPMQLRNFTSIFSKCNKLGSTRFNSPVTGDGAKKTKCPLSCVAVLRAPLKGAQRFSTWKRCSALQHLGLKPSDANIANRD